MGTDRANLVVFPVTVTLPYVVPLPHQIGWGRRGLCSIGDGSGMSNAPDQACGHAWLDAMMPYAPANLASRRACERMPW
jgi:hypothetical protein